MPCCRFAGKYCPIPVVMAHELGHIMQIMPGEREKPLMSTTSLCELAPTIDLIVMQDAIYKELHSILLEQEVEYPCDVDSPLKTGKIANGFRAIKEQTGLRSYEDVLLTPAAQALVDELSVGLPREEVINGACVDLSALPEIVSVIELTAFNYLMNRGLNRCQQNKNKRQKGFFNTQSGREN